jgi:hypothetical protein
VAADLEYSELTIGALIGHRGSSITSRYTHRADPALLAAADTIAARILQLLGGGHTIPEVPEAFAASPAEETARLVLRVA